MDSKKWAHPVSVGNVQMCPYCLMVAVEHAFNDMMSDYTHGMTRRMWAAITQMHLAILDDLHDDQVQTYSAVLAEYVLGEERRCRFRNVHRGGAVVDKGSDSVEDDVPY